MSGDLRGLPKPQRDLIKAVSAEYRRNHASLTPRLAAHPHPAMRDPAQQAMQVAQNTLRTCMEATLQQMGPYTPETCASLAIRLASYALSAAPLEDQDFLLAHVLQHLGPEHMRRVDQGIAIKVDWEMVDGSVRPNIGASGPPGVAGRKDSDHG